MAYDNCMMSLIKSTLSCPRSAFVFFAGMAALSLAAAFTAQYAFGLQPCVLCVYQRWPFGIVIVLCVLGLLLGQSKKSLSCVFMGLTSLTYFANSIIASYHTGVERHWWKSFLEGCAVPDMKGNITDVLAQIAATPAVRCDEIPWTDPVLGLSMANYNVVLCLGLGILALMATILSAKHNGKALNPHN